MKTFCKSNFGTARSWMVIIFASALQTACLALPFDIGPFGNKDLSFTAVQVQSGEVEYARHCASCHGGDLMGIGMVSELIGDSFTAKWNDRSTAELFAHVRAMPPLKPDARPVESDVNILAFILNANGRAAGKTTLPTQIRKLARLPLAFAVTGEKRIVSENLIATGRSELLDAMSPVSTQMLNNPSPDDWLSWHRTNDSKGFSPLSQINTKNVDKLARAWRLPLPPGKNLPTPLIHDGVMFFYTFPDTVMALDAADGTVLWRYQHKPIIAATRKMGLALHGDKVIVPTSDMRMLALNAKTGALIWDEPIVSDVKLVRSYEGYDLRAAPIIAGDKILQGVVGSIVSTGSFIVALDVNTGKEVWRFYTLARPGEPGGNTWNDLPLKERTGGSVWIPGSYDPELNLAYFGVAPTYFTQPLTHPIDKPGVTNDALYTNATLALNPDTGELVWHYQHLPNDQWDLDWAFERQIINIPVKGVMRKTVVNVGKMAIVEAVDAATGEYLFSIDMGLQNIVSAIDPVTGAKTINPDTVPRTPDSFSICPTSVGARSWPPAAYNPQTKRLFLPLTEGCFKVGPGGTPFLMSGVSTAPQTFADSADGNIGRLQVVDLENQKLAWRHRQPAPLVSSVLATAGGIVLVGDLEPSLKAFDEATGALLWQTALEDDPSSSIVTYRAGGRQYIAVVVGQSNNHLRDWRNMSRAYAALEGWIVEPPAERQGPAILVFALPE